MKNTAKCALLLRFPFLKNRFLSTFTHLFNDYEPEKPESNQKPQRRDRCHQDGPEQEQPEELPLKTWSDETRAPMEGLLAGI